MRSNQRAQLVILGIVFLILTSSTRAQTATQSSKESPMIQHATGPFDVKMIPQDDKAVDGVTRMLIDKQYHGDLEGAAKGQMLTGGMSADKSGAYVAIEKFTGTLHGRTGSFV